MRHAPYQPVWFRADIKCPCPWCRAAKSYWASRRRVREREALKRAVGKAA